MTRAQKILENIKRLQADAYRTQQDKNRRQAVYNLMKMQWRRQNFSLKPPGDRTSRHISVPVQ